MPYFIQEKDKPWDNKSWWTRTDQPFETVADAQKAAERRYLKPGRDYRIVQGYTVTRYKLVKM